MGHRELTTAHDTFRSLPWQRALAGTEGAEMFLTAGMPKAANTGSAQRGTAGSINMHRIPGIRMGRSGTKGFSRQWTKLFVPHGPVRAGNSGSLCRRCTSGPDPCGRGWWGVCPEIGCPRRQKQSRTGKACKTKQEWSGMQYRRGYFTAICGPKHKLVLAPEFTWRKLSYDKSVPGGEGETQLGGFCTASLDRTTQSHFCLHGENGEKLTA